MIDHNSDQTALHRLRHSAVPARGSESLAPTVSEQTRYEALKTLFRITVNGDGPSWRCSTGYL
ncbi:hypothetical protein M2432_005440 [Mycobacterium sp. OTB74]|nr:hypothetical protein [Mycobacterium sp. OTB74]